MPQHLISTEPAEAANLAVGSQLIIKRLQIDENSGPLSFSFRVVGSPTNPYWQKNPVLHDPVAQFDKANSDYFEIRKRVTTIYAHNHAKYAFQATKPSMTELVVVKEDDDWYRGKVQSINRDQFTIELIDEGRITTTFGNFVFKISPELEGFPAQARCALLDDIRAVPRMTVQHKERFDYLTRDYIIAEVLKVNKVVPKFNSDTIVAKLFKIPSRSVKGGMQLYSIQEVLLGQSDDNDVQMFQRVMKSTSNRPADFVDLDDMENA